MSVNTRITVEGWFKWEGVDKDTGRVREIVPWTQNLITNIGLDALAQQADVMTWFHVGTDDSEPQVTDTWVGALVASTNTIIENVDGVSGTAPYYGYKRKKARFDYGVAAGNLNEGAVGWSATTGTAFSHMLTRDVAGDPKTITVLSNEYLDYSYELRYIVPTSDVTGVTSISGVDYNFTVRALSATNTFYWSDDIGNLFQEKDQFETYHRAYAGNIAAVTASQPSGDDGGSNSGTTNVVVAAYLPGNYYRDFTVTAGPTQWNVAGGVIRSLVMSCTGNRWQAEFAKVSDGTGISKSTSNSLVMSWRVNWARV